LTKKLSPLGAELLEALHEVYDDVTGRKRLFRYPPRFRVTENLSGEITLDIAENVVTRPPETDQSMFIKCVVTRDLTPKSADLR